MDLPSFLLGLLPAVAVAIVCVVAFVRRRRGSMLIVNPYTMVVQPTGDTLGTVPAAPPLSEPTTGQTHRVRTPEPYVAVQRQIDARRSLPGHRSIAHGDR